MRFRSKKSKEKLKKFLLTKEIVMLLLVAISFGLLALEHFEHLSHTQLVMVEIYEIILAIILLVEFLFELHFAKDRKKYWRTHWFYLLAAIPIPTASFEILRGIRVLRLLKLLKIFTEFRYEHNTRLFK